MINTGVFPLPPQKGGGTESHIFYLSNELAKLGHEVHLVSDIVDNEYFHKNVIVHEIHAPPPSFKGGFLGWVLNHLLGGLFASKTALATLLKEENFDIIHIHGRLAATIVSILRDSIRKNRRTPLIYTLHDLSPWYWKCRSKIEHLIRKLAYTNMELRVCNKVNHIIATTNTLKNELVAFGIPSTKITVIPNGVDTTLFKPSPKPYVKNYFLFVGQLVERKGVDLLLYSLTKVSTNIKCLIVGDGPQYNYLSQLAKKLKLGKRVKFLGSVSLQLLITLYQHARFLVLPSLVEPFGITLLEAMACGCPVIATRIGGVPEIVKNGYNGFLVNPYDIEDLSEKIELLANHDEIRQKMALNARKFVERNYSWSAIALKVNKLYHKVLNSV